MRRPRPAPSHRHHRNPPPRARCLQGRRRGGHMGVLVGNRSETDHGAEDEPGRRRRRIGMLGRHQAAAADAPAVDADGIGPLDHDRLMRRRDRRHGANERHHARVEHAPRRRVRLVGLDDDRELGDIEATDGNQGSRAELRGVLACIGDRIAGLAQASPGETAAAARSSAHSAPRRRCDVRAASSPDSTFLPPIVMLFPA